MSKARLVITAVVVEGRTQGEVARAHGVSQGWISRLVARYRAEGEAAFWPRSRRPKTSPGAVDPATVELIIRLRKELTEDGLDAGPDTIGWHLAHHHGVGVSAATVARYLTRAGLVTPAPKKRPRSSYLRFAAELPNECWQSDATHYPLADALRARLDRTRESSVPGRAGLLSTLSTEYEASVRAVSVGAGLPRRTLAAAPQCDGAADPRSDPWVGGLKPFLIQSSSQFRSVPPPALDSAQWAAEFNEVKAPGRATGSTRTDDQTYIAKWWQSAPVLSWNEVARQLIARNDLDAADSARLLALQNLSGADAAINCWNNKYYFDFWRPWNAIPRAGEDDNPATEADPMPRPSSVPA
jgi:transposase